MFRDQVLGPQTPGQAHYCHHLVQSSSYANLVLFCTMRTVCIDLFLQYHV